MPPPLPPAAGGPPGKPPSIETFTQHDTEKDVFHCSYGPLQAGRTVWYPEREIQVRLDQHSLQVIGFSIPDFTAWHAKHADEDGGFEMDLPDFWPASIDADADAGADAG